MYHYPFLSFAADQRTEYQVSVQLQVHLGFEIHEACSAVDSSAMTVRDSGKWLSYYSTYLWCGWGNQQGWSPHELGICCIYCVIIHPIRKPDSEKMYAFTVKCVDCIEFWPSDHFWSLWKGFNTQVWVKPVYMVCFGTYCCQIYIILVLLSKQKQHVTGNVLQPKWLESSGITGSRFTRLHV